MSEEVDFVGERPVRIDEIKAAAGLADFVSSENKEVKEEDVRDPGSLAPGGP
jgi:hypothetical protein